MVWAIIIASFHVPKLIIGYDILQFIYLVHSSRVPCHGNNVMYT